MQNNPKQNQKKLQLDRVWTAYEKNQLLNYGFDLTALDQYQDLPVEYITGWVKFCGYDFEVTDQVLIPRVESEQIVTIALNFLLSIFKSGKTELNFADIGTGAGNLGLSLFLKANKVQLPITGVLSDISLAALELAQNNLQRLLANIKSPDLKLIQSDLLQNFPQQKFDLIMANLPYIPSQYINGLDPSVKNEPQSALDGGLDGLQLIKRLLQQAGDYLKETGIIILEVDERVKLTNFSLGLVQTDNDSDWSFYILKDEFNKQRYVLIGKYSLKQLSQIASVINNS